MLLGNSPSSLPRLQGAVSLFPSELCSLPFFVLPLLIILSNHETINSPWREETETQQQLCVAGRALTNNGTVRSLLGALVFGALGRHVNAQEACLS